MEHADRFAVELEHAAHHVLRLVGNGGMQERHRIVDHAERRRIHAIEHRAAALGRAYDLVPARLDEHGHARLLGHGAHAGEVRAKRIERPVGKTVVADGVGRVGAARLGADRAAAEELGKAQAGFVLGQVIGKLCGIGRGQVLVAAEHGHLDPGLVEHATQVRGQLGREATPVDPQAREEHLARELQAGKTELPRHADALIDRAGRQVMQAHAHTERGACRRVVPAGRAAATRHA